MHGRLISEIKKLNPQEESSFCEQKEAKKLCQLGVHQSMGGALQ